SGPSPIRCVPQADAPGTAGATGTGRIGNTDPARAPRLGRRAADPHPPDLGALLEVVPGEIALVLGVELVEERLRVVIVDQDEALPGNESRVVLEDHRMATSRRLRANVQGVV